MAKKKVKVVKKKVVKKVSKKTDNDNIGGDSVRQRIYEGMLI